MENNNISSNGGILNKNVMEFFEKVFISFSHKETGYEAGCPISFSSLVLVKFLHMLKEF